MFLPITSITCIVVFSSCANKENSLIWGFMILFNISVVYAIGNDLLDNTK